MTRGTDITDLRKMYSTPLPCDFPQNLLLNFQRSNEDLRYGENPHQQGAIYSYNRRVIDLLNLKIIKAGKGGLSATNRLDIANSFTILKYFPQPSVVVMKHINPAGFSTGFNTQTTLENLFISAWESDKRSAYGSI